MTIKGSGSLAMSEINAEFGRGNNLNAYRGVQWWTDGGSSGNFSGGQISMSEFYGKRATVPVTPWVDFGWQVFGFGTVGAFGGCGASGWSNGEVRISSTQGISVRVYQWYADYGWSSSVYPYNNGWYYCCQSNAFMDGNGQPYSNTIYTNAYATRGRDTPRFRIRTQWDGSTFVLFVDADCKGGGWGYPHVAFASGIGYSMNSSSNYSYGSNPDYGANMPHSFGRGGFGTFFAMT